MLNFIKVDYNFAKSLFNFINVKLIFAKPVFGFGKIVFDFGKFEYRFGKLKSIGYQSQRHNPPRGMLAALPRPYSSRKATAG